MESQPTQDVNPEKARNEAMKTLDGIIAELAPTGALDSEIPVIQQLQGALMAGKITPEEALQRAENLRAGRNDYH